jgi:porin
VCRTRRWSSAKRNSNTIRTGTARACQAPIKLGGWTHFGTFSDLHFGTDGLSLADPLSNQDPLQHGRNYGIYGVIEQQLYRLPGAGADKGVGVFARVSASPSDRNLIDVYFDAGVTFAGLIPARPDDAFGIAVAYGRFSDSARGFDRDQAFFSGLATPVRNYEAALELTYQAQIVPGWTVQPNFQYIFHPGGSATNPLNPSDTAPIRNASVIGLRTTIRY